MTKLLELTPRGLYCAAADIYIDPSRAVPRAVITHAHSDHARPGSAAYLCAARGVGVLRTRLGEGAVIQGLEWGEELDLNGVTLSLHPAGHILGSAQVRLEHRGEIAVVAGDYKVEPDPTCDPFEPIRCHTFVTESTFALPVYRWPSQREVFAELNSWWRENQAAERTSVIYAYSLGKAQRLLHGLDAAIGPIGVHPAVAVMNDAYMAAGVRLPDCVALEPTTLPRLRGRGMVAAPAGDSSWLNELAPCSSAFASGWMLSRAGRRRRGGNDRGFVLSDHADWPGLLDAVRATEAREVWATHGFTQPLVRHLRELGYAAHVLGRRADAPPSEESSGDTAEES